VRTDEVEMEVEEDTSSSTPDGGDGDGMMHCERVLSVANLYKRQDVHEFICKPYGRQDTMRLN
jgi:hypothetical protein